MDAYYKLHEKIERGITEEKVKKELQKFIDRDPYFFDPYVMLFDLLEADGYHQIAEDLLNNGYEKVLKVILDKKGNWPDELHWGFIENRHIIRLLVNRAILFWKNKKNDAALDIFRNLLRSNPFDNVGARNYILAIREGMTLSAYEKRFDRGGYYDMESFEWFEQNMAKYPEEFEGLAED